MGSIITLRYTFLWFLLKNWKVQFTVDSPMNCVIFWITVFYFNQHKIDNIYRSTLVFLVIIFLLIYVICNFCFFFHNRTELPELAKLYEEWKNTTTTMAVVVLIYVKCNLCYFYNRSKIPDLAREYKELKC